MSNGYQNLSDDQLQWGYWFVTHKEELKRIFIIFLIICNSVLWLFSLYKWTIFFLDSEQNTLMMNTFSEELVDFQAFKQQDSPAPFQILGVSTFKLSDSRYDLMAKLRNPNEQWLGLIEYQFTTGNNEFRPRIYKDFILPGDEKYFFDLAINSETAIGNPKFNILSLEWRKIPGATEKTADRLQMEVSNAEFLNARTLGLTEEVEISKAIFTVKNNAAYNFWKVGFPVVAYNGNRAVGVNYLIVDNFLSGETKDLEVSWFNPIGAVSRIEVEADINIFDSSNYKEFKGETLPDIRDLGSFRRR